MGLGVSGGGGGDESTVNVSQNHKLQKALVIEDVKVVRRDMIVDIPKLNYVPTEVRYEKPIIIEKETTKYAVKELETIKYVPKEEITTKYVIQEFECEKPVVREVDYEKPVVKLVEYEKPIINNKVYDVCNVTDVATVRELVVAVKELNEQLPTLQKSLQALRDYKLIEKVISVPKIEFHTIKVERIEWVDVKREKPNAD